MLELARFREMRAATPATRRDVEDALLRLEAKIEAAKSELIRWTVGSVFTSITLVALLIRYVPHP